MYFYPVAACRDPTRGWLGKLLLINGFTSSNRGLSRRAKFLSLLSFCIINPYVNSACDRVFSDLMGSVFDTNQLRRGSVPGKLRNAGVRQSNALRAYVR